MSLADLERSISGISQKMLLQHLKELIRYNMIDKKKFYGYPLKVEYFLTGVMEVMEDKAHKEMIWKAGDELYYPKGVNDPDYCVFKFTGKDYRYYESLSSFSMEI